MQASPAKTWNYSDEIWQKREETKPTQDKTSHNSHILQRGMIHVTCAR